MSKEDWAAVMDSEIFRTYIHNELNKQNIKPIEVSKSEALESFSNLEDRINQSPRLKKAFRKLQHIFTTNSNFTQKVDRGFVDGVLLLDLSDEEN